MFTTQHVTRTLIALAALIVMPLLAADPAGSSSAFAEKCVPPPADMTNWWAANETADDLVGQEPAILVGDTTFDVGLAGDAFDLDGDGDWVNLGADVASFGTRDFSFDLWFVQRNPMAGEQILYEKYVETYEAAPRSGWGVVVMSGAKIRVFGPIGGDAAIIDHPVEIVADTWYHLAITRSGDTFTLYLNGEPVAEAAPGVVDVTSPVDGKLGHRGGPADTPGSIDDRGFYFDGLIDEVHFFERELSADEIAAIHEAGAAGLCAADVR